MSERPQTPSTPEEPTEKLGGPGPEAVVPSSEEDVTYEEVIPVSTGISIPEIPEIGPEGVGSGVEMARGEERAMIQPTEVGDIPDIPEEKSWSEVVYEKGGPPIGFQA